jgi:hypothetical protein
MIKPDNASLLAAALLMLTASGTTSAGEVRIVAADFRNTDANRWSVSVTLQHADTGWDHYADDWRVVDGQGNILGDRVLLHPHVDEQPFTRSLDGVSVPAGITTVYIEAHDKVHGWTGNRLTVELSKARDGRLQVEAK